jgi:hypothetical protein
VQLPEAENDVRRHRVASWLAASGWTLLAGVICLGIAYFVIRHSVLTAAFVGFSPVSMLHPATELPNFANDYPGGEAGLLRSSIGRLYQFLGQLSDAHDELFLWILIVLEAATLMAGAAVLCRQLNSRLPLWTAIAGGILLAAGTIASSDLARWFHPSYGYVYNFAYAAGFFAMAKTLQARMLAAGAAIGLAATFHPIIALCFGFAAGMAVLVRVREYSVLSLAGGGAVAFVVSAGWYLIAFGTANVVGSNVDGTQFEEVTRLMSFHWYPVGMGVFGARSWETLLPSLAMLTVFAACIRLRTPDTAAGDGQLLAGVAGLVVLSLLGVWISLSSTDPLLIKLALHRASLIALLLAAALSVPRLFALAVGGQFVLAAMAGGLVLLPFWRWHGLPIAGAVVFALAVLLIQNRMLSKADRLLIVGMLAIAAAVAAMLAANGHFSAIALDTSATIGIVISPLFLAGFAVLLIGRFLRSPAVLALPVALGAYLWLPQLDPMAQEAPRLRAQAYLEAQLWARANTAPDSVFMIDPTIQYAWRQYSQRPSFGTLREWLHSGWIYDTDAQVMAEGLRRATLLGLNIATYTDLAKSDHDKAYVLLLEDAKKLYYGKDASALASLAQQNGVSYFLFDRKYLGKLPALPIAFENDQYAILKSQLH